ncbi:hypothetical protein Tco_0588253 [Tanacetum coccineum]
MQRRSRLMPSYVSSQVDENATGLEIRDVCVTATFCLSVGYTLAGKMVSPQLAKFSISSKHKDDSVSKCVWFVSVECLVPLREMKKDVENRSGNGRIIRWQKRIFLHLNLQDEMSRLYLALSELLWVKDISQGIPGTFLTHSKSQATWNQHPSSVLDSDVHHTGDDFISRNLKFVLKEKGKGPISNLVDEDDEAQQESITQEEGDDPDLDLAKKMILEAHQEKGEGEGDDADMERAIKLSLDPAFLPQGQAPVGGGRGFDEQAILYLKNNSQTA